MTNTEIIQAIKAEIDKLYGEYKDKFHQSGDQYHLGLFDGLEMAKRVIDTLESEKPMNQDELIEEVKRYYSKNFDYISSDQPTLSILTNIARHFAQWGADHFRDTTKMVETPVSDDLEEAAKNYALNTAEDSEQYSARYLGYKDGAKWQKEQMMKDIPKWHNAQRGSCFDKHTNFILSAREGHFYCSSMEVPRDGYILLVDELERLPKEDEK